VHSPNPNRLHLWPTPKGTTYFIMYKQRIIGQVEALLSLGFGGLKDPPILLHKPFSEHLVNRIKDLVNRRDGTNRDIVVKTPPRPDHPAIQKYLTQRMLTW